MGRRLRGRVPVGVRGGGHPPERDGARLPPRPTDRDAVLAEIARLAALPQVRAVGETGLDYYRDNAPPRGAAGLVPGAHRDRQAGRQAADDPRPGRARGRAAILAADGAPEQVIFHCFSGDAELAERCAAAGYLLSFAGTVTFGNAAALREAAAVTPAELILAETDAPFLTPAPHRGKSNSPAQVAHTVRALAAAKQMDVAELCAVIEATGERVFGPWPT